MSPTIGFVRDEYKWSKELFFTMEPSAYATANAGSEPLSRSLRK